MFGNVRLDALAFESFGKHKLGFMTNSSKGSSLG